MFLTWFSDSKLSGSTFIETIAKIVIYDQVVGLTTSTLGNAGFSSLYYINQYIERNYNVISF